MYRKVCLRLCRIVLFNCSQNKFRFKCKIHCFNFKSMFLENLNQSYYLDSSYC